MQSRGFLVVSMLLACAIVVPARAADPVDGEATPTKAVSTKAASATATEQHGTISFDEYRDYQMQSLIRRQEALTRRMASTHLTAEQRKRGEDQKAYLDWLATMPAAERDRRLHDRFNQIDANRDGQLDDAERVAWRDKQREYYRNLRTSQVSDRRD